MDKYLLYINGSLENGTNDYMEAYHWYGELTKLLPDATIDLVHGETGEVFQSNVELD